VPSDGWIVYSLAEPGRIVHEPYSHGCGKAFSFKLCLWVAVTVYARYVTAVYNYTRTKVASFYEHIWQLTIENNHVINVHL